VIWVHDVRHPLERSRQVAAFHTPAALAELARDHDGACGALQDRLARAAKGAAVRGVNIGDVRALQVALPPRLEQEEIVRRVAALNDVAASIEHRLTKASRSARWTPTTILRKAFVGELVATEAELARAEERGYESGAELLARARVERAANGGRVSPRKPKTAASIKPVPHKAQRRSRRLPAR
jgi:hypothetical protein